MEKRNLRKERIGVVTSNMMEKSIVVSEVKRVKHPMYGKFVLKTKNMSLTMTKMIVTLVTWSR
jgi:small subunit ribosomal protein S17